MIRKLLFLVGLALLVGYAVTHVEITDYQKGYGQGVRDAQQAKEKIGKLAEVGGSLMQAADIYPAHKDKSAQWNEGYRTGMREGLNRQQR